MDDFERMEWFLMDTLAKMSQNMFAYSIVSEHSKHFFLLWEKNLHLLSHSNAIAKLTRQDFLFLTWKVMGGGRGWICELELGPRDHNIRYATVLLLKAPFILLNKGRLSIVCLQWK